MSKQIVSDMTWDEADLASLAAEKGFRMRGLETTRLDTLVDAGFAFVLSFLAISQDSLPTSFDELLVGIKAIPALVLSFFMLIWFWLEHRRWSRRYGVETGLSILLSVSLVFVLMIYIFPLRLLFESMFGFLTADYLPFTFEINNVTDARHFFGLYSVGFMVMSLLVVGLYAVVLKKRNSLKLNAYEYGQTRGICVRWLVAALFALLSLVLAYTLEPQSVHWSAFVYFALPLVQWIYFYFFTPKLKKSSL